MPLPLSGHGYSPPISTLYRGTPRRWSGRRLRLRVPPAGPLAISGRMEFAVRHETGVHSGRGGRHHFQRYGLSSGRDISTDQPLTRPSIGPCRRNIHGASSRSADSGGPTLLPIAETDPCCIGRREGRWQTGYCKRLVPRYPGHRHVAVGMACFPVALDEPVGLEDPLLGVPTVLVYPFGDVNQAVVAFRCFGVGSVP